MGEKLEKSERNVGKKSERKFREMLGESGRNVEKKSEMIKVGEM